ncbi:MAG: hypothetical protein ACOCYT_05535 [Chloroflexota bacterium]
MNTSVARTILNEAARLVELTATFQAYYGRGFKMSRNNPQPVWDQYNAIMDTQSIIANLLDPDALKEAHHRFGRWWERQDVMDAAMAQQLINEVSRLIASTAHVESHQATDEDALCWGIKSTQRAIAGMLHPESYRVVSDPEPEMEPVGYRTG